MHPQPGLLRGLCRVFYASRSETIYDKDCIAPLNELICPKVCGRSRAKGCRKARAGVKMNVAAHEVQQEVERGIARQGNILAAHPPVPMVAALCRGKSF